MPTKSVKKSTSKKPVKKVTAKAPAKTAKKKVTSKKTTASMKSFRLARDIPPFFNFKISIQTFYWILLVAVIIFLQLWILKTQLDAANATDAASQQLHYK